LRGPILCDTDDRADARDKEDPRREDQARIHLNRAAKDYQTVTATRPSPNAQVDITTKCDGRIRIMNYKFGPLQS
jgi:hypothetical protein